MNISGSQRRRLLIKSNRCSETTKAPLTGRLFHKTGQGMDNGGALTDRLFAMADIPQGARALDVGCGTGAVTLRLAQAVGATGHVTGLDLNADALSVARQNVDDAGHDHVAFVQSGLLEFASEKGGFDVITLRRVLMYLPDQPAAVAALRRLLNPGGCLIVHEHDAVVLAGAEDLPLYRTARSWIWDTVRAEGANLRTGFALHGLLSDAGFGDIALCAEALVETPHQPAPTAQIVRALLPRIAASGVAKPEDIDIKTLGERLQAERRASGATTINEMMFGAIAQI